MSELRKAIATQDEDALKRMYDKATAMNAIALIDPERLIQSRMMRLAAQPQLVEAMDKWIMAPDYNLLPQLQELAKLISGIYFFNYGLEIYRGFNPWSTHQQTMGLCQKSSGEDTLVEYSQGTTFTFGHADEPLSFTSSKTIAEAFGPTVVSTIVNRGKDCFLVVTDELMALIAERHNHTQLFSQREVILLPPYEKEFVVVEKK